MYIGICVPKVHFSSNLSSNQTVVSKNRIPNPMFSVNVRISCESLGKEIAEPIKGTANHAAEILIDNPERALNQGRFFFTD